MVNILYLSALTSERLIHIHEKNGQTLGFAMQKFNRMLVKGLLCNGANVTALTSIPVNGNKSKKKIWVNKSETEKGIFYRYIPFVNITIIRQLFLFWGSFLFVLFWGIKKKKNKIIICDALNVAICMGSLLACKLNGIKSVCVLTDLPGQMAMDKPQGLKANLASQVSLKYLGSFSYYVLLTQQMNNVVNKKNRPYIIMEGLVSSDYSITKKDKEFPRTIMYAGGLLAIYGIQMLIDAVKSLPFNDIQLVLYGAGKIADELKNESDTRIVYRGLAPNDEIVEAERKATLLVNPRPTHEAYTQFSFPSKNMEYMVSGTPLLTTCLPGMPKEYYPYVFLFDEETTEGYARKLKEVLSLDCNILEKKGRDAQNFVLTKKNNILQAKRILGLIN